MNKISREKINKETEAFNNDIDQTDLTDIAKYSTNSSKIHIFLKHNFNILQHRLHVRSQTKS